MKKSHEIVLGDDMYVWTISNNRKYAKVFISQNLINDEQPELIYKMFMELIEEVNAES